MEKMGFVGVNNSSQSEVGSGVGEMYTQEQVNSFSVHFIQTVKFLFRKTVVC